MNCWMSYSVVGSPARMRRPISAKPSMMTLVHLVGGLAVRDELLGRSAASNCWTRSALVTTETPGAERTSSIVPASTRET